MTLMSRNQINFIIGAVCVFVLLALGLAFFYISSQKEARAEPKPAASAASVPETIALASNASAPEDTNAPKDNSKLAQLFQRSIFGKSQEEVEAITGPATKALGDGYTKYNVDNCLVSATYQNKQVQYIGLRLNPSCSVDLTAFGIDHVRADNKLTFGQIETALGQNSLRQFQSSCLSNNCGNAVDPSTYATYNIDANPEEPQALEIELEAVQLGAAGAAADQWSKPMMEQKGEEWLNSEAYNCTDEYQALARKLFQNIPVSAITISE
jgi:hypothetical protein